jgi:protein-S-isoprenylcysteine O-methyltransferase Ste14
MTDPQFRVSLIILYSLFSIMRLNFSRLARKNTKTIYSDRNEFNLLKILIVFEVLTFFIYIFFPEWIDWGNLAFIPWVRWTGLGIGFLSLVLFLWVHLTLGNNFSELLRIRNNQSIVVDGPYRYVRHPMYTAFIVLHIGVFLLSANWFIGLSWNLGLILILIERIPREETMLLERFGGIYKHYLLRTGILFPKIHFSRPEDKREY